MLMPRIFPLLLCAVLAACATAKPLHGTAFSPPQPPHRFTLETQDGSPYVLAQSGRPPTALYFGFTHCTDICPQTLAKLGKARARAGLSAQQLPIVMVTIDPARDTRAAMRAFFAKTGVRGIGLIGSRAQLAPVYRAYGVAIKPEKNDIGHTDYVYLLDREGRLAELLSPQMSVQDIADDLRAIVE